MNTDTTGNGSAVAAKKFFAWILKSGKTQKKVASSLGVQAQAITNWRTRGIPARQFPAIARLMQTTVDSLTDAGTSNVTPVHLGKRRVPVISYVQAGTPTPIAPDMDYDNFILTDLDLSDDSFGLEIIGDSMEPEFREGDKIVIDPDVHPQPGDFVVATANGNAEATFKKYRLRGIDDLGNEIIELVPLNPDYAPIISTKTPIRIVGVMMEHRSYRRR